MRRLLGIVTVVWTAVIVVQGLVAAQAPSRPPAWAYGVTPAVPGEAGPRAGGPGQGGQRPGGPGRGPQDETLKHLPGSNQAFTLAQLRDFFNIADWYPEDHPAMPDVVVHGRRPDVRGCGLCHYPNGKGRPENAGVSGLPAAYFVQTMMDFKNDLRKSAEPRKQNTNAMIAAAKAMTDEEIKAAADYFASITWTTLWIKVVESAKVPKTRLAGGMFLPLEGSETEPLGQRIIEMPENAERTELRDPRSPFIAYVPAGSIKKGEALVTTGGGGKTIACGICHGTDLRGLGPVPGIAGRSPSYLVRQLYDMQAGTRKGTWTELMKPAVAKLTEADMIAIAAYSASRQP
jgi:cytochrome c553